MPVKGSAYLFKIIIEASKDIPAPGPAFPAIAAALCAGFIGFQ